MSRFARIAIAVFLMFTLAMPTYAGVLAPNKASQVVNAFCSVGGSVCDFTSGQIVNRDGSLAPFAIPAGQVLVVTKASVWVCGGTPGNAVALRFTQTTVAAEIQQATFGSNGCASASFAFPTGIIFGASSVPSGFGTAGTSIFADLNGFFVKDK